MVKKYVIIGAGAAGINAARTLRNLDSTAKIIVLSSESALPYNKCFLVSVLAGQRTQESLFLYHEQYYHDQRIELVRGCVVKSINRELQTVCYTINNQEVILEYTKLLFATGARARTLYQPQDRWYQFHTFADLDCILQELDRSKPQSCIVIGGGVTGLECADALAQRGLSVSIITQKLLPSFGSSEILNKALQKLLLQQKFAVHTTEIESYSFKNNTTSLKLIDGTIITADFVITTCGVERNIDLGIAAGLQVQKKAIVADKYLQTRDQNIYAAGDCCIIIENDKERAGAFLWADAVAQGITAAKNMHGVGQEYSFDGAMTVTTIAGTAIAAFGCVTSCGDVKQIQEQKDNNCWCVYYYDQNSQVCGIVAFNMLKEAMQARREITKSIKIV